MSTVLPTPIAAYAAALGLLAVTLTVRVILRRVKTGIQSGDGGDAPLAQAIRAQGNFVEQVPLALLLLVLAQAAGAPAPWLHGLGSALLLARLANAWGLSHSLGPSKPRQAGAGLTGAVVTITSLLILYRVFAATAS